MAENDEENYADILARHIESLGVVHLKGENERRRDRLRVAEVNLEAAQSLITKGNKAQKAINMENMRLREALKWVHDRAGNWHPAGLDALAKHHAIEALANIRGKARAALEGGEG